MANRYHAFGDLTVIDSQGERHAISGRQGEVLALLLAASPDSVSSDRLIEKVGGRAALWTRRRLSTG